ncbi:MAG: hypothetical protein OXG50_04065 [bacterium]|nr:hypothetical protein [bacterium]
MLARMAAAAEAAASSAEPEPPGLPKQQGPLDGVPAAQRRILAMLRTRAAGATPALIAAETGLSLPHVRRSLRALRTARLASDSATTVMWGYRPQRIVLWRIAATERAVAARPQMGWAPPPPEKPPTTVPAEFWWLFWSGTCASELRLPEDALHIADTLIGGPDPAGRAWALETLPLDALRELRSMTGYDTGSAARRLDSALAHRERAHSPAADRREHPSGR